MFNKIYEFLCNLLKQNYKLLIFIVCFYLVATYPVPYYIFTSGGISDLSDKFEIEGATEQKGSYNLSYVSQLEGNVITYLTSYIIPNWDLVEVELYQANGMESIEEIAIRDKLSLDSANQTAVMLAYEKAEKEIIINDVNYYVAYVMDYLESSELVKVGDVVKKVDDVEVSNFDSFFNYVETKNVGDQVNLQLLRNGNIINTLVTVKEIEGKKVLGMAFFEIFDYEVNPNIKLKFNKSESGGSAGLMTTLAIYDTLVEDDLTNGMKIAGTGTIDSNGSVGEIGGVKYKLKGAESAGTDIFFVPFGDNYDECVKIVKEKGYDIKLVPVNTLDDAINYLKNLKK